MDYFIFDVDGVILDFHAGYAQYCSKMLTNDIAANNKSFSELDFIYSQGFANLPPIISAKKFNKICQGKKVKFVTNLPNVVKQNRIKNLTRLGFEFEELHIGGLHTYNETNYPTKAEVLKKKFTATDSFLFVDDMPENCIDVKKYFPKAKIFMLNNLAPVNKNLTQIDIVANWAELEKKISSI